MKRLLTAIGVLVLCGSSAVAAQTVITAFPEDNSYKFVWSDDSAVFKAKDGKTTVRCHFYSNSEGVDDDAKPYTSSSFKCENRLFLSLKQTKGTNETLLILTDEDWKILSRNVVSVEKKQY